MNAAEARPTHEDLCILSRIFNDRDIAIPHGTAFRINEWLKTQIASELARTHKIECVRNHRIPCPGHQSNECCLNNED